jgi:hypothetical protein
MQLHILCKLTDVENIQRLQKSIRREAREAVMSMLVSPINLDRVIKIFAEAVREAKIHLGCNLQQVESLPSLKGHNKRLSSDMTV